jgi:hypothetical protein
VAVLEAAFDTEHARAEELETKLTYANERIMELETQLLEHGIGEK